MHALYPTSPTVICWALADPTFGKRAQTPNVPASGGTESGASEHISLDDAITKLQHHKEADERAGEILAAAITLRDSVGRDRKQSLRQMCGDTWGVSRKVEMAGQWRDRPIEALARD